MYNLAAVNIIIQQSYSTTCTTWSDQRWKHYKHDWVLVMLLLIIKFCRYPNDAEKDELCFQTGISKKKVSGFSTIYLDQVMCDWSTIRDAMILWYMWLRFSGTRKLYKDLEIIDWYAVVAAQLELGIVILISLHECRSELLQVWEFQSCNCNYSVKCRNNFFQFLQRRKKKQVQSCWALKSEVFFGGFAAVYFS